MGDGYRDKTNFDVLTYQSNYPATDETLQLVPKTADGSLPSTSYFIGLYYSGDAEYVCLTSLNLSNFIGATFPSNSHFRSPGCHIAVDGAEFTMPNYQIMTTVTQPPSSGSGFGGGGGAGGGGGPPSGGHGKPNPQ